MIADYGDIIIFGASNIVNNGDLIHSLLSPKIRIIPTYTFDELRENIHLLGDEKIIYLHSNTNDIKILCKQYFKSDVVKEIEIEKLAKAYSKFVLDLIHGRPYFKVLISLTLPRKDQDHQTGFSNPNKARKKLNKELVSLLKHHPQIFLIDNDSVISRDNGTLNEDGCHLNPLGIKLMIGLLTQTLDLVIGKDLYTQTSLK